MFRQIQILLIVCSAAFSFKIEDVHLKEVPTGGDIIQKYGYKSETHKVTTEDGYILVLDRILTNSSENNDGKPPVLLMHGLAGSSTMYVDLGPEKGLGFILADSGYDVWMGNARGNSYSNQHTTINRTEDPAKFYNFSWHEIGLLDLPANIDYILEETGQKNLQYVGHSQGGTIFYILMSSRPEYNDKIRLASLMGPAGIMKHTSSPLVKLLADLDEVLEELADLVQLYAFPFVDLIRTLAPEFCAQEQYQELCVFVYFAFGGYPDEEQLDVNIFQIFLQTTPSDLSLKQIFHYLQGIKSGIFRQYDFGIEGNLLEYGSETPPEYNLTAITAPVALYYGKNDQLVDVQDVQDLGKLIQNLVHDDLIEYEKFNHLDFLYATDIVDLLYNDLIDVMKKYQ